MPRPKPQEKRVPVMIRVPKSLHAQMQLEAQEREVSLNRVVQYAVESWLKRKATK